MTQTLRQRLGDLSEHAVRLADLPLDQLPPLVAARTLVAVDRLAADLQALLGSARAALPALQHDK